jgi:hypothetical protein
MKEARDAWLVLKAGSRGAEADNARSHYNIALGKLFDQLRCGPGGWDERASAIGTTVDRSGDFLHPDGLDALMNAESVRVTQLKGRRLTAGVGVAAVGWKKTSPVGEKRAPYLLPNGLPYHVNVLLSFDSQPPRWQFRKRWRHEEAKIGFTSHVLAADWSAPNAFYWRMCQLDDLLVQNVILPDRFTEETGLYFVTPYDPEKIPVVFVHGLVSSPDAFKNMLNELMPEKWFRDHYQIWLFNYPTGPPWAHNSYWFRVKMREAIDLASKIGPTDQLNRMVLVGHSMGGLLVRSSVTDPGTALYDAVFRRPLSELPIDSERKRLLEDGLLYTPLSEPQRVVFMAVPHRGSPMATWGPSKWIAKAIRLPKTLTVELLDSTLGTVLNVVQGDGEKPHFTSIGSLSPNAPTIQALSRLSLPKRISFHSIIGDRGKGTTPDSSDGVVPYWSSHVTPVSSEKIVPSGHGVPDSPEAAEELKRILRLHIGLQ